VAVNCESGIDTSRIVNVWAFTVTDSIASDPSSAAFKVTRTSVIAPLNGFDEVEVAAVPGEAFGPSGYLRFSYATSDDDIKEGIARIKKLITEG